MILNNYYLLRAITDNVRIPMGNESEKTLANGMTFIDGTTDTIYVTTQTSRYSTVNWALRVNLTMRVGTGTTDPVGTDYSLENDVTDYVADKVVTLNVAEVSNRLVTTMTISGRSTYSDNIVISEVGVTKNIITKYINYFPTKEVLLVRELLEDPITIAPGQGFSITFVWEEA